MEVCMYGADSTRYYIRIGVQLCCVAIFVCDELVLMLYIGCKWLYSNPLAM